MKNLVSFNKIIVSLLFIIALLKIDVYSQEKKSYKGNAILGNGNLCLVYSDDPEMVKINKAEGIIHLYYENYGTDFISSTKFSPEDVEVNKIISTKVDLDPFYTAKTVSSTTSGIILTNKCFVAQEDVVVLTSEQSGAKLAFNKSFNLTFRKKIVTDKVTKLKGLKSIKGIAIAEYENNTWIAVSAIGYTDPTVTDSSVNIKLGTRISSKVIIALAKSESEVLAKINTALTDSKLDENTNAYWNNWIELGKQPQFVEKSFAASKATLNDYYKRTLYAVKSACLNGQIPADMTGQFVTNNMPQLYPRDALMSARVLMLTGHLDEARQIISFWANPAIPKKSKGEFYARYDAFARAIDGGSGARFDEPEWDANGYYIQAWKMFYDLTGEKLASEKFLYELADFLVNHIDATGLLYEGGIVEWTGYLPATNMTCSAALKTIAKIAEKTGDKERSVKYLKSSERIASALSYTFDSKRNVLASVRFHGIKTDDGFSIADKTGEKMYMWDASFYFGYLWGFQQTKEITATNEFHQKNTVVHNGGMQYFGAMDNAWLSDYGDDAFIFTTAAAAQYLIKTGDKVGAKRHIDWMLNHSNSYGLMPERISTDEKSNSEASPLTWCNAEFALTLLTYSQSEGYFGVKGKDYVDAAGNKVFLKGTNLGNWLVPEGYMFKFKKTNSPSKIYQVTNELLGPEKSNRFWAEFRDLYFTKEDLINIKQSGFNSIRVPFNFKLFADENYPNLRNDLGFVYLDRVIKWAKDVGLYVVLDMHCAPGGQTGDNIDDSYGQVFLFESPESRALTIDIWERIARRYSDDRTVIGYDLLNEPIAHYFDVEHLNPFLEPFFKELSAAIREIDKNHILFYGGAQWDSNFKIFGAPYDSKAAYTFHKYWSATTQDVVQEYIDFSNKHNTPLWMGESGENTNEWIDAFRKLLEKNDISWCFWPYKKMDSDRGIVSITPPAGWDKVIEYAEADRSNFEAVRKLVLKKEEAQKIFDELLLNIKAANCKENTGYLKALGLK